MRYGNVFDRVRLCVCLFGLLLLKALTYIETSFWQIGTYSEYLGQASYISHRVKV